MSAAIASDQEEDSVYDSADSERRQDDDEDDFEDQGSSSSEDEPGNNNDDDDDDDDSQDDDDTNIEATTTRRRWMHADDDSSDDDEIANRIGRVPLHWYDDEEHIGYTVEGQALARPAQGDRLDRALDGKQFVVHDALHQKDVALSSRQLELIRRVQAGAYAHPEHEGEPDYVDYYSSQQLSTGLQARTPAKARFQPNPYEAAQVQDLVDKLDKGVITMEYLTGQIRDMNDVGKDTRKVFELWNDAEDEDELNTRKGPMHIAPPKVPPPGHVASYRPPDEYLPTTKELEEWKDMDMADRPHGLLIPRKFANLRSVGAYQHALRETFERMLDLYLCPRKLKRKLNINPESLVPSLPPVRDLRPFPTAVCMTYEHGAAVRAVAAHGGYLASGGIDGRVCLWEVATGRCVYEWNLHEVLVDYMTTETPPVITSMAWNPFHGVLLVAIQKCVVVIRTGTDSEQSVEMTQALLSAASSSTATKTKAVEWHALADIKREASIIGCGTASPVVVLQHTHAVTHVTWHAKGDYFCTVAPKATGSSSVLIHQLSKASTQSPFTKTKGETQKAEFHPTKPFLFVASTQHVRVYHLVQQRLLKRVVTNCKWISSMALHATGDHVWLGSLDKRAVWLDLDLGGTPYKVLKYHTGAIRATALSRRYPLSASASDDGTIHVFHARVYTDQLKNPLLVPVKVLRRSEQAQQPVLCLQWHTTQPWIFGGCADGKVILWHNV